MLFLIFTGLKVQFKLIIFSKCTIYIFVLCVCKVLQFCRGAFFRGQVEQPVRGLTSLITHQDMSVLVAINGQGVYVIDDIQCVSQFVKYIKLIFNIHIDFDENYFF